MKFIRVLPKLEKHFGSNAKVVKTVHGQIQVELSSDEKKQTQRRIARSGRKQLSFEMLESRRLLAAELVSRIPAGLESPYGNENSGIADFTNARGLSLSADGRFVVHPVLLWIW